MLKNKGMSQEFAVKKIGVKNNWLRDFYHHTLKISWWEFTLYFCLSYLSVNAVFAFLYFLDKGGVANIVEHSYWKSFLFSFQTSSTVGYGHYFPRSTWSHIVMILDSMSGLLFVATATGIAFSRLSRPSARVLFSNVVILHKRNGKDMLSFRIANERDSEIVDANIKVVLSRTETSLEGETMRRMYDLKLVRSQSPLFALSWTVMHEIRAESPLREMSDAELMSEDIYLIVSLTGIDDVQSQQIYDRKIYKGAQFKRAKKFRDIFSKDSNGNSTLNYKNFHEVVAVEEASIGYF